MKLLSRLFVVFAVGIVATSAGAVDGLITFKSPHNAKDTMNRFEALAKERGLTVFARIDHAAGAANVDKQLRPTEVLIFGNPQGGTPLMEYSQTVGIDLPLKVLVWEDAASQVWLAYNDPVYLLKRHGAPVCPSAGKLNKTLADISAAAVAK